MASPDKDPGVLESKDLEEEEKLTQPEVTDSLDLKEEEVNGNEEEKAEMKEKNPAEEDEDAKDKDKERHTRSPRRASRSPSSSRSRSRSRRRRGHSRSRSASPKRRTSPSPKRRRDRSEERRRSRSSDRRRSPSPRRRRSPSPKRRRSPSPQRRRSPSPQRRRSPSPDRRRSSRSPRRRSRTPPRRHKVPDLGLPRSLAQRLEPMFESGQLTEYDVDERCITAMKDMKEELAHAVLDKFCEANMSRINNKSGFMMGIVRRIELEPPGTGPDLSDLPRPIRYKLEDIVKERRIRATDIEGRAIAALKELPEDMAHEAIERFSAANLESIRTKTGFLIGIVKRIRDEGRSYGHTDRDRDRDDRDRDRDRDADRGRDSYRSDSHRSDRSDRSDRYDPHERDRGYDRRR
ncbi:hypothetical protein CYMTET_4963 [Cymbomonas tetramitiformis]|uniref:Heterogeneous nuclear ribonucleoprotein Q acidic domain-containing protein n=1 Tax=Cymbomonas tetramitiformis TaxID=36881 RepID=A0AAE0H206_9CHLO|nr:hypothetical protein CYMTET_4963 [Cymbomonas tetramitiformis]